MPPPDPAIHPRNLVLLAYVLHALAPFLALLTGLVAAIINLLQRRDAPQPWAAHHQWMLVTFVVAAVGSVVGGLTTVVLIGWPILALTTLWWLYRMLRGLLRLSENRPPYP